MGVFGRSVIATPPRIAGVNLKAFSAFHALALMEIDSPYINGDREPNTGDTTAALLVCSSVRSDGLKRVVRWHNSIASRIRWAVRWLFCDHATQANAIADHVAASVQFPEVWESGETTGKRTGAPWPYYIVNTVAHNLNGIAYQDLWDMPIAELICHKAILSEVAGVIEIATNDLEFNRKRKKKKAVS